MPILLKRENNFIKLLFFIALFSLFLAVTSIIVNLANQPKLIAEKTFFSSVIVGERVGVDVNGTALIFGMVTPGGSSKRAFIFDNSYGHDVLVEFISFGDIAYFFSNKTFIVKKDKTEKIEVNAYVLPEAKYGIYEGNVRVKIYKL